jgi:catechol 1,2-dioxygenase
MNHQEIDQLAKAWIVDAADRPANPRVQAIVLRLVSDLCKAMEDLDIQPGRILERC